MAEPSHRHSITEHVRPDWDDYFLGIAKAVAARADCQRAKFGAVIVDQDRRIKSTGYNGSEPGGPSCLAGQCPRGTLSRDEMPGHTEGNHDFSNCISLHAETNAIAYAGQVPGGTIYIASIDREFVTPCDMCSKLISAAGIARVVTQ